MKKIEILNGTTKKFFEIENAGEKLGYGVRQTNSDGSVEAVCIQTGETVTFTNGQLRSAGVSDYRISAQSIIDTGIKSVIGDKLDTDRNEKPVLGAFVDGEFVIVNRVNIARGFFGVTELVVNNRPAETAKGPYMAMFRQVDIADINNKVDFAIAEPNPVKVEVVSGKIKKFFEIPNKEIPGETLSYGLREVRDDGVECMCIQSGSVVILDMKTLEKAGLVSYTISNLVESGVKDIIQERTDTNRNEKPRFGALLKEAGKEACYVIINRVNLVKGFFGVTELAVNNNPADTIKGPYTPIFRQVTFADIASGKTQFQIAQ